MSIRDTGQAFNEALSGLIVATAASLNAANVLEHHAKAYAQALELERLQLAEQRATLLKIRSTLGDEKQLAVSGAAGDDAQLCKFDEALAANPFGDGTTCFDLSSITIPGGPPNTTLLPPNVTSLQVSQAPSVPPAPPSWVTISSTLNTFGNTLLPCAVNAPLESQLVKIESNGTKKKIAQLDKQMRELSQSPKQDPGILGVQSQFIKPIGSWYYSVLPPRAPDDSMPAHDMAGVEVLVPHGWEVLSTQADLFAPIIEDLSSHGWGTLRLCVEDGAANFAIFGTPLRAFGIPGARLTGEKCAIQQDKSCSQKYRFSDKLVSCRLVIRSPMSNG